MILERTIGASDSGKVLREYLHKEFHFSTRLLRRLKANCLIKINGLVAFTNTLLKEGDSLSIELDYLSTPTELIRPENIPLDILYEDNHLIAINKQPGLIIHPSVHESAGTIANGLAYHFKQTGCVSRIHPISRLDRNTSGVIVFAKDSYTADILSKALRSGAFTKEYLGVVEGQPDPPAGFIDLPLGRVEGYIMLRAPRCDGKRACTYYETLHTAHGLSLLLLRPITGRTHQLRAHLSSIGHPIISDGLYGRNFYGGVYGPYCPDGQIGQYAESEDCDCASAVDDLVFTNDELGIANNENKGAARQKYIHILTRQALHSWRLTFRHPHTENTLIITAQPPTDFRSLINQMKYQGSGIRD